MANIKDVAKLAGLGTSTVSRYFNKTGYISKESEQKIKEACKELNYVPNALARAVKTKQSRTICLIVPNISHSFFADISAIIENVCIKRGYKVLLVNGENKQMLDVHNLHQGFVDGAILCAIGDDLMDISLDIPMVALEDVHMNNKKISCVTSNPYEGATLAFEYLVEKGCKRICYIKNNTSYVSSKERMRSYLDGIKKYDMPSTIYSIDEIIEKGIHELTNNGVDGCIAWNDTVAAQLLELCHDADVCVPQDLQMIGYDDSKLSRYVYPKLTTISQSIDSIATYAANMLIDKIEGIQQEEIKIELQCSLIVRGTTKP